MTGREINVIRTRVEAELEELTVIKQRISKYLTLLERVRGRSEQASLLDVSDACLLLGAALDDFYLCVERIFKMLATEVDELLPKGESWHRDLLLQISREIPGIRPPVISQELAVELDELRRFRHLFRNIYGHSLQEERVKELALKAVSLFERIKEELSTFFERMLALSERVDYPGKPRKGPGKGPRL
ncbi:antitoxin [Ammonifex thiophilus]|uniref:Antitoxin n=1 Tax=Ammonifex thiophilus TaxID=444093 RepID=A0A3D8P2J3_9THEO|nr:antitoxin [Ammonifex thiophilus]RDV81207.1 antitoxin [Ammonifex thiophilus]